MGEICSRIELVEVVPDETEERHDFETHLKRNTDLTGNLCNISSIISNGR